MKSFLKSLVKSQLRASGYQITPLRSNLGYETEKEAREAISIVRENTMVLDSVLVSLYDQIVFCENHRVPGCYVECGTWKGGCCGIMAIANLRHGQSRRIIHLFDSFEGIPEPDASLDGEKAIQEAIAAGLGTSGKLRPVKGFYDQFGGEGTLETNKALMEDSIKYDPKYLFYHKGWFQNTMQSEAGEVGDIAVLRIDCDWYASIRICLEYLYDNVVPGGFVIIDDYGAYTGAKKAVDEFLVERTESYYLHHVVSTAVRYWVKGCV